MEANHFKMNSKTTRVDPIFDKFLEDVACERVKIGSDKKTLSKKRLTLAITRVPNLKRLLINSKIDL